MVPTTACTPLAASQSRFVLAASAHGEVDGDVDVLGVEALGARADLDGVEALVPGDLAQVEPGVVGIDGGDQLQVGVGSDGGADRGSHPSAGAEDGDTQGHGVGPYIPTVSPSPANARSQTVVPGAHHGHRPRATEHALDHGGHVLDRHGPQRGDVLVDRR